jgi:arginine repressor
MLSGKSKSEQVDAIKQLIRQNKYKNNDITFQQCIRMGLSVNQHSLSRFAEKLELLDRAERSKQINQDKQKTSSSGQTLSYAQVKQRETEITFELGELKIRENKLLEELNTLSKLLDVKQFN